MTIIQWYIYPQKQSSKAAKKTKTLGETIPEVVSNKKVRNAETKEGATKATTNSEVEVEEVADITLVVSGEGLTKEAATASALRSAIEQSFGTFVSANTIIFNDELVRDEIATVSSGNIKSYRELSDVRNEDGSHYVSVSAVVSVGGLISYAQSHGSSAEFAGQTFAMNMKMRELNKQNEKEALENMIALLTRMQDDLFDFEIDVGEPKQKGESNSKWTVPLSVSMKPNANFRSLTDIIANTLSSLSLSSGERTAYETNGMHYTSFVLTIKYGDVGNPLLRGGPSFRCYLRSDPKIILRIAAVINGVLDSARNAFFIMVKGVERDMRCRNMNRKGYAYYDGPHEVYLSFIDAFFSPLVAEMDFSLEELGEIQAFEVVKTPAITRVESYL